MAAKSLVGLILILLAARVEAQLVPTSDISIHDPVLTEENGIFYLFSTGMGISVWSSSDMENWKREQPVFRQPPQWAIDTIPNFRGHIWAPDIYFHNGTFYLYYSVSAFGKNTSAIGVATNTTLDPEAPEFRWVDHGPVIQSYPGVTDWNAIDPNIIDDDDGHAYMSFGSFWGGLKLVKLSHDRLSVAEDLRNIATIASRKPNPSERLDAHEVPKAIKENAIEAPFIFKKGAHYYLFASVDYCCKGVESTYKMVVGRSDKVTGPYLDMEGKDMAYGGGSLLLAGDDRWHGVGHNAVVRAKGRDYLIFHGYDGHDGGKSKLRIAQLQWNEEGWPSVVR